MCSGLLKYKRRLLVIAVVLMLSGTFVILKLKHGKELKNSSLRSAKSDASIIARFELHIDKPINRTQQELASLIDNYVSVANASQLDKIPKEFHSRTSDDERKIFYNLLNILDKFCIVHKIPMFMNFGTLIGSFRHHDFTPWDDDADVLIPMENKFKVWTRLRRTLGPGYMLHQTANTQFRFVASRSRLYHSSWEWKWPYIDIDFYRGNKTHIFTYSDAYIYSKEVIFPLHRRPFGPLNLNAPRDGLRFLELTYKDLGYCASHNLFHRTGQPSNATKVHCAVLKEAYPFVHRSSSQEQKLVETLKMGDKFLYSRIYDEPNIIAGTDPFSLKRADKN